MCDMCLCTNTGKAFFDIYVRLKSAKLVFSKSNSALKDSKLELTPLLQSK